MALALSVGLTSLVLLVALALHVVRLSPND